MQMGAQCDSTLLTLSVSLINCNMLSTEIYLINILVHFFANTTFVMTCDTIYNLLDILIQQQGKTWFRIGKLNINTKLVAD